MSKSRQVKHLQTVSREPQANLMLARYYSSSLDRFLSPDSSLKIDKNLPNPQRWNRYLYVLNNPLKFFDPDGQDLRLGTGGDKSLAALQLSVPKADRGALTAGTDKAGHSIVKVDNSHKSSDPNFKNIQKVVIELRISNRIYAMLPACDPTEAPSNSSGAGGGPSRCCGRG